jgi:hypothetical protein
MKKHQLTIKLVALLVVSGLTGSQVRGDDGIAGKAFEAQANETTSAPEVQTMPPQAATDKTIKERTAKPIVHRVVTDRPAVATAATGIKAPSGTLIHPRVQDAGISSPTTRISVRSQAEDYHVQQMY